MTPRMSKPVFKLKWIMPDLYKILFLNEVVRIPDEFRVQVFRMQTRSIRVVVYDIPVMLQDGIRTLLSGQFKYPHRDIETEICQGLI